MNQTAQAPEQRSVGALLGIGIFLAPVIFSWFTLRKGYSTLARILSLGWMAAVVLIAVGGGDGSKSTAQKSVAAEPSPQAAPAAPEPEPMEAKEEPALEIKAADLVKQYENNEVKADANYKGKLVRTSGVVDQISKDILGNAFVTLGSKASFLKVQCTFSDDDESSKLVDLNSGDTITVAGRVSGKMMHVQMKDCTLIQ